MLTVIPVNGCVQHKFQLGSIRRICSRQQAHSGQAVMALAASGNVYETPLGKSMSSDLALMHTDSDCCE